jgi:HEAT repeat protein
MQLCVSKDRLTALNALVALAAIGDPASLGTGSAFLASEDLPMRKAAIELVSRFPADGLTMARSLAADAQERRARIGIELLSAIGTPEALRECARALLDTRPGVKIQALLALNGRCPEESRAALLELRQDPSPLVRAVAQKIDPGR